MFSYFEKRRKEFFVSAYSANPNISTTEFVQAKLRIASEFLSVQELGLQYRVLMGAEQFALPEEGQREVTIEIEIHGFEITDPADLGAEPTKKFRKTMSLGTEATDVCFWYRKCVAESTTTVTEKQSVTSPESGREVLINDAKDADGAWCATCFATLKEVLTQMELRWPGGFQQAFMLNVPTFLNPTLRLLKAVLSSRLQESVFSYDDNDSAWMPELLKFIEPEKLPPEIYVKSQQQQAGNSAAFSLFPLPPSKPGAPLPPEVRVVKKKEQKKPKKTKDDDDDDDD